MSDSQDGISSPMSPSVHALNDGSGGGSSGNTNNNTKLAGGEMDNINVERKIREMILILSNCVGDVSKEKQLSIKKMEDHTNNLKKCLADIELGLTEQLKLMEDSLMSTDFNCCRSLYDHLIETMDDMYQGMRKFLGDAIQRKNIILDDDDEEEGNYKNEIEEIDPANFPKPVLPMNPEFIGRSILKISEDKEKAADDDENILKRFRISKNVYKRLFQAPEEEYQYPALYRIPDKLAFHKALKDKNINFVVDELWESEGLLRAEGFALLAGADKFIDADDEDEEEKEISESRKVDEIMEGVTTSDDLEAPAPSSSPMTDDVRELETLIEKMKLDYQKAKKKYEEYKEMLDKNEEPKPDPKYVDLLKVEAKQLKITLKNALEHRNEIRNWNDEDLKQRKKDKLARKLIEAHKKPKISKSTVATEEKSLEYMSSSSSSSSSSESNGPGSVQSDASFLNSDSSALSPEEETPKNKNQEASEEGGGEEEAGDQHQQEQQGDESYASGGGYNFEDESSLHQLPSSNQEEDEQDVEMGES